MTQQIKGSIVALITPMLENGQVDYDGLKQLVDYHVASGTNAIVAVGTTGESTTLSHQEHIDVVLKTVEFANGRIPVIAGTGSNSTAEAIEITNNIKNSGVICGLSVVPYYNKPTQEGMYQHYKTIVEATGLDLLIYNVPSRTGSDIKPETVARLAKLPHIIGIKEATGDVSRVEQIRKLTEPDFILLSGDDETSLEFMLLGGNGVISVANNVIAPEFAKMCNYALSGNIDAAKNIDKLYHKFFKDIFIESNPIPIKWLAHLLGLIKYPRLRLPLTNLSEPAQQELLKTIKECRILK